MKKLIAILLLAIMIVSLAPAILAEEDDDSDRPVMEKLRENRPEIKNERQGIVQTLKELKETRMKTREDLSNARDAWKTARTSGNEAEMLAKAKEFMSLGIQKMIAHLELVKERISNNENYPEQANALTKIDEKIAKLNEDLQKIEAASTMKDLRGIAGKAKGHHKEFVGNVKRNAGHLINAKLMDSYRALDKFTNRVDAKIEEMKENGEDVSGLESSLEDANSKLAEAKALYEEAKTIFNSAENSEDPKEVYNEGKAKVKEAANKLKEAKTLLKDILSELKGESEDENSDN